MRKDKGNKRVTEKDRQGYRDQTNVLVGGLKNVVR